MATLPSPPLSRWSAGRVIGATLVALLVGAGFYMAYRFATVLFVLFVAIVLATAMRPAVQWLERWRVPPWLGVLLIYGLVALGGAGLVALLAPLLIEQIRNLVLNTPTYYVDALAYLRTIDNALVRGLVQQLPPTLPVNIGGSGLAGGVELSTVGQAVGYLRSFGWALFSLAAMLLIIYFWILDREQIVRSGILLLPAERRAAARDLWDTLEEKVGAFVRGQILLCLSIGGLTLVAFLVIGIPNALVLAVLAGIFEAVPYIGPIFTAVVAIVLTLAQAPDKILWVIIACIIIQQLENALLVPRIMDRTVGVNAVVTLLAITAFGSLLGLGGAIMAIPLAVVLQVLFGRLLQTAQQAPTIQVAGRDQIGVLRYQAQDLAGDLRSRIRTLPERADHTSFEEELEMLVADVDQLLQTSTTPSDTEPLAARLN